MQIFGGTRGIVLSVPYSDGALNFGTENRAVRPVMTCPPQHYDYDILTRIIDFETLDLSFAIVRHPLAGMVSDYKWAVTKSTMANEKLSFGEWLDACFCALKKMSIFWPTTSSRSPNSLDPK
jgi:hypothetical protein